MVRYTQYNSDEAVSPVIGILLMLVVTIIIAAVVSGFAGSLVQGQAKVPQAQISGKLSVSDGFSFKHNGGDPLTTSKINVIIRDSDQFGQGLEQTTTNIIAKTNITDSTGTKFWAYPDGSADIISLNPGDTATISAANCTCNILQPANSPQPWVAKADGYTYDPQSNDKSAFFKTCLRNSANIGKTFKMEIVDTSSGKMIARADVPITA